MNAQPLKIVVGIPLGVRAVVGDDQLGRLSRAHPRVRVQFAGDADEFSSYLADADGVMIWASFAPLLATALGPGSRLRWVHALPAGIDDALTPELVEAEHVALTSSKGPMGPLMAEHAVLLMLALARDLPGFLRDQAERRWRLLANPQPTRQLFGRTILILGIGVIGGNLARMCRVGFGMRVLGLARTRRDDPHVDRWVERTDLHAALGEADVVALCLALTPATERIIDGAALAAMKMTAYLVNVARGGLVDEPALVEALRAGRLAGAGLDVATVEPLPQDSPLWSMPNVIITPHVSPGRDRLGEHLVDFWCENLRRFAEGEPLLGGVDRLSGY